MFDLEHAIPAGFDCMVYEVESGTKILFEGEIFEITDSSCLHTGDKFFCTEKIFNEIRKKSLERAS